MKSNQNKRRLRKLHGIRRETHVLPGMTTTYDRGTSEPSKLDMEAVTLLKTKKEMHFTESINTWVYASALDLSYNLWLDIINSVQYSMPVAYRSQCNIYYKICGYNL